MTCPVQEVSAPDDLIARYSDPPDGLRVNMILSVDGCAAFGGVAGPLSNPCDQGLLRALRGFADVVLVGAGTVRAEQYGPVRLTPAQRAQRRQRGGVDGVPPIAVVTATGDVPESLFTEPAQPPLLVTTAELARRRPSLQRRAEVLVAGDSAVDLGAAIGGLRDRGLRRILCEGGPMLFEELAVTGLVDEVCLTVSPTLAADPSTGRPPASRLAMPTRMELAHALRVGDYMFLRYRRPGHH